MKRTTLGPRGRNMIALGSSPIVDAVCRDKAASALAEMDGRTTLMITGYWPPAIVQWKDVNATIAGLLEMSRITTNAIQEARLVYDTSYLQSAEQNIYNTIGSKAIDLLADKAPMQGNLYKDWIIASLYACSNGMKAVIQSHCEKPWYVEFFEGYQAGFNKVWNVVADVGDGLSKVPDLIAKMWTVMKWGGIGLAAYWLFTKFPAKKSPPRL